MNALAALNQARAAWEATQPQYVLDLWPDDDALEQPGVKRADAAAAAAPGCSSAPSEGTGGRLLPPESRHGSGALELIERPGSDSPQGSVLPGLGGEG